MDTITTVLCVIYAMGFAWAGARYVDECNAGVRKASLKEFAKLLITWPRYLDIL